MKQIVKRYKIVYLPYPVSNDKINEYTVNMVRILQEKYSVESSLAEPMDLLQILETKAVFLNWTEQQLDIKMKIQLTIYKLLGVRIIWVFHNRYPHDTAQNNDVLQNMEWLADHCSRIILHSQSSIRYIPNEARNSRKAVFVPHILYEVHNRKVDLTAIRKQYELNEYDFIFTIFGVIRPYKNIEGAIEAFKKLLLKDVKLLIVGNPINHEYAKKIVALCKNNKNIILDLKYISNSALDHIIDISDVVIMPYKSGSSINSGVMIHSFSRGKTVITPDICMARDLISEKFMYIYQYSLEKVMLKAYRNGKMVNRQMGERAKEYINQNNSRDVVKRRLYDILQN